MERTKRFCSENFAATFTCRDRSTREVNVAGVRALMFRVFWMLLSTERQIVLESAPKKTFSS